MTVMSLRSELLNDCKINNISSGKNSILCDDLFSQDKIR